MSGIFDASYLRVRSFTDSVPGHIIIGNLGWTCVGCGESEDMFGLAYRASFQDLLPKFVAFVKAHERHTEPRGAPAKRPLFVNIETGKHAPNNDAR